MTGDHFAYIMIALNIGACVAYGWQGNWNKSVYWLCVMGLNICIVRMR